MHLMLEFVTSIYIVNNQQQPIHIVLMIYGKIPMIYSIYIFDEYT